MNDKSRKPESATSVRIDRWLWAARFFKTRSLAKDAIKGGKVEIDGHNAKPSATVHAGQHLHISKGEAVFEVVVDELADKRGPASQAETLYTETQASREHRNKQAEQHRMARLSTPRPTHRPDKKQRRQLRRFKQGSD